MSWHRMRRYVEGKPKPIEYKDKQAQPEDFKQLEYTVKRFLGLSYLWTGSIGVKLQVWATWLFYAVVIDLGDAVADAHLLTEFTSIEVMPIIEISLNIPQACLLL